MKNIVKVLITCFSILFISQFVKAEESRIIEIKDLKGGVQKTLPVENSQSDTATQQNKHQVLKGRIDNKAEFHVLNDIQLNLNEVTGPGKSSSSLSDGVKYIENLNMYGKGNINELKYQFNLGGRTTNDDRVDIRSMSLTSLQGQATFRDHTLNAGDVFESFSQYSLSSSLKGASYKYYNTEDNLPDVTLLYGYAYPRWESFIRLPDTRTMQRLGYGVNLRHDFTPNFTAGASFLRSQDDERQADADPLYHNNIYSFDYEYKPIQGLTIRGESAFSQANRQPEFGADNTSYFGHAHRIQAIGDGGPSRVNVEFERVNPKFETFLGSASQDREKAKIKWKYKYKKNITFNTGFMWFMNKLHNEEQRSNTYKPEFGVKVRKLFGRKYSETDLNFKLDRKSGVGARSFDHFTNLSYRDRFGLFDIDNNAGFTSYNTNKNSRESYDYNYSTSISTRRTFGMFVLKPSINAGTNFVDDEINNKIDKIIEYSTGLGIDIPKRKITSNWKFGQNILNSGNGDNSNKLFTNISIYYKPSFLGRFNNSTMFVRAMINDFNFQTNTRNFVEKSISMGINIPIDLFVGKKKPKTNTL
ncbi:MAG: hypothetical protein PHC34_02365 [Candidatus Gastranaerophilales bacterium]|nr:hypothetical protein [Candidatus Gastranaerophilales bacterium]